VRVFYDPFRLDDVLVFLGERRVQRAFPQQVNAPQPAPERPVAAPLSFDYLGALRAEQPPHRRAGEAPVALRVEAERDLHAQALPGLVRPDGRGERLGRAREEVEDAARCPAQGAAVTHASAPSPNHLLTFSNS
jgi:hypothetical protein